MPANALELCCPSPAPPPPPFAEVLSLSLCPLATPVPAPRSSVAAADPTGDVWRPGGVSVGEAWGHGMLDEVESRGKGVVKQLLCCESLHVPSPKKKQSDEGQIPIYSAHKSKRAKPFPYTIDACLQHLDFPAVKPCGASCSSARSTTNQTRPAAYYCTHLMIGPSLA